MTAALCFRGADTQETAEELKANGHPEPFASTHSPRARAELDPIPPLFKLWGELWKHGSNLDGDPLGRQMIELAYAIEKRLAGAVAISEAGIRAQIKHFAANTCDGWGNCPKLNRALYASIKAGLKAMKNAAQDKE